MDEEELTEIFKRKCEELGGKFEFIFPMMLLCELSSVENGREMIRFSRKLEIPDDKKELVMGVSVNTDRGHFYFRENRLKGFLTRRYSLDITASFKPEEAQDTFRRLLVNATNEELAEVEGTIRKRLPGGSYGYTYIDWGDDHASIRASFNAPNDYDIVPLIDRIITGAEKYWDKVDKAKKAEKVGERTFIEL